MNTTTAFQRGLPLKRQPANVADVVGRVMEQHGPKLGRALVLAAAVRNGRRLALLLHLAIRQQKGRAA